MDHKLKAEKIQLVCWPSPQDYNEAIQTPTFTFADSDLRVCEAETDNWGIPRPRTGTFASVYKMQSPSRTWAVRCFLQNIPGQRDRYRLIHNALENVQADFTVGFTYMAEGLRLWDRWVPALKMEWFDGQPLNLFVEQNLGAPEELRKIAESIKNVHLTLRYNNMAHGDLQHGNVLVSKSAVKLVDYDGLFVPALAGTPSPELGHRNFQHPKRTPEDYNERLDNFSAWVIYASIICLSEDADLWRILDGGDDCLLFRHSDFVYPDKSIAFYVLENHRSETVRRMGAMIRNCLSMDLSEIPYLDAPQPHSESNPITLPPCELASQPKEPKESDERTTEAVPKNALSSSAPQGKTFRYPRVQAIKKSPLPIIILCAVLGLWPVWTLITYLFRGVPNNQIVSTDNLDSGIASSPDPRELGTPSETTIELVTPHSPSDAAVNHDANNAGDHLVRLAESEHERNNNRFAEELYGEALSAYKGAADVDELRVGKTQSDIAHCLDTRAQQSPSSSSQELGSRPVAEETWKRAAESLSKSIERDTLVLKQLRLKLRENGTTGSDSVTGNPSSSDASNSNSWRRAIANSGVSSNVSSNVSSDASSSSDARNSNSWGRVASTSTGVSTELNSTNSGPNNISTQTENEQQIQRLNIRLAEAWHHMTHARSKIGDEYGAKAALTNALAYYSELPTNVIERANMAPKLFLNKDEIDLKRLDGLIYDGRCLHPHED